MAAASIIIPSYNGCNKLRGTLGALKSQVGPEIEIVVVVDGSTDNTLEYLQSIKDEFPNLKILATANQGRAMARNAGASFSSGTLLIFIDDDVRLSPDAIDKHLRFHQSHPETLAFGFLEMDPVMAVKNSFWNYRREVEQSWREDHQADITLSNYAITSANLSLPRSIFEALSGFDSELRDSEDFDFGIRALLHSFPMKYVPEIRGFHDDFSDLGRYVARQQEYLQSKFLLLKKHPEYLTLLPRQFDWMSARPGDSMKTILFGNERLWELILGSGIPAILPKGIRHQLYSVYVYVATACRARKKK